MYRHSPVRNPRSKGIKTKHVVQVCLLIAVCFWLLFQVKRSHDKKKEFDANNTHKISSNTRADEIIKFGRKDIQPKVQETTIQKEDTQEQEDEDEQEENKHEEQEQDEEEKDNGDNEIDENELEKPDTEIDRDEVDIIDVDRETEENDGETENRVDVDHDEDGSTGHTNEAREEHYKADDASSAVITHDPENEIKNTTLDNISVEDVGLVDNETGTVIQEKDTDSANATSSDHSHENGPPANTTTTSGLSNLTNNSELLQSTGEENSYDQSESENLETNNEEDSNDIPLLEEKEVQNDVEEDTAAAE